MTDYDPVNHPAHYTFGKIEVIEVIEDWDLGYHLGNAVKYIARSPHKSDELEDLQKARWYLNRQIERLENADRTDPTDLGTTSMEISSGHTSRPQPHAGS